jgi:hypothetical protein
MREAMEILRIEAFKLLGIRMGGYTNSRGEADLVWAEESRLSIQTQAEEAMLLVDHHL